MKKNEAIKVSVIAYRFHIGFSLKSTTRPASYYTTHHMHYALQPPKHGGPKSKKKIVQHFLKFLIKLVHIFDLSPIIFSNCDGKSSVKSHRPIFLMEQFLEGYYSVKTKEYNELALHFFSISVWNTEIHT